MSTKSIIAIIPARSGSKSVKDKNIKKIHNKPLIGWSIEQCINSKIFLKIYVTTDSKKYANIAKKYDCVEIIQRPKAISKDNSTDYQMIMHAINSINIKYDFIAHIRPTSPLRKVNQLRQAYKYFKNSKFSSLRTVHEMPESSYKTFEIKKNLLTPLKNLNFSVDKLNNPRQSFPKTFIPNGIIDIYRKEFILKNKILFGSKVKAFITPYSHEIDTIEDLKYVKYLWKKK
jgi:CMP-N,N'-diacetyllegionaminic acid synthase